MDERRDTGDAGVNGEAATARKVARLRDPAAYPHAPPSVEVRETHMAWVFLAGERVYKMKKPVRHAFLDFSTLDRRAHFVAEELRLNRRLAPDVYLGAAPLTEDAAGELALDGAGRVVEWLVVMRRLPETRMLDHLIGRGAVGRADLEPLAARLVAFYAGLPAAPASPGHHVDRFRAQHAETARVLTDPALAPAPEGAERALDAFEAALRAAAPLLETRVREGRIVEGHGDLRPEHVCLTDPPAIIDCLEFDRELRLVDPFDEIAFLGLEAERLGAPWVWPLLRARLSEGLRDAPPETLHALYRAYRALLRARLSLLHLAEPDPREPEKWRPLAARYVAMAEAALSPRSR
jgi:aminoglycoside phosphotransferase family enzyme